MTRQRLKYAALQRLVLWLDKHPNAPQWLVTRATDAMYEAWAAALPRDRQETIRPPTMTGPGGDA